MIDAIDRALYWAAFALWIVALGAFAYFLGLGFWSGLPIVWDGSWKMWGELWLGLHAIGFFALATFLVCSAPFQRDMLNNWMEKTASERARDKVWILAFLTCAFGLSGLILDTTGAKTPLWLDLLLTSVGGFGVYLLRDRNSAMRGDGIVEPERRTQERGLVALALGSVWLIGLFLVLPSRPDRDYYMADAAPAETQRILEAPAETRRILEALRQGPDFDGLSEVPALELPIIENPGRQAEIDAALVASVERSPVGAEHDSYRRFLQTLSWCPSADVYSDSDDCWGSESRRVFRTLVELPSTAAWFARENGRAYVIRRWKRDDVSIILIGRFSEDLQEATIAQLILPLGPGGLSFGDENIYWPGLFSLSELPDGSVLLSLDKGSRCEGERRDGVMVRLSPNLEEFVWVSPLRVAGGGFAYNEARIFAVDGGSCESDYLYELDLDTGQVVSRTRIPSGDAFVALDGNDLYLILYNRFMHYHLN